MLPRHDWYYGYDLAVERYRGLGDREDHLHAGACSSQLEPGETFTLVASTNRNASLDGESELAARVRYEEEILKRMVTGTLPQELPDWIGQLVLAADQFIVDRPSTADPHGKSIIAGYYWFGDWGRDTMISLAGLTLTTLRFEIARSILHTFARYVDQGMLPNRFPDAGEQPEYNTVDATLWYFEAVKAYIEATGDLQLLEEVFPVLDEVIAWHTGGTRYNIHVDPADGLLYAGEHGVQLTWMDAKIGEWVVTPRIGKPVEVNALWYNALMSMSKFARRLNRPPNEYDAMAAKAARGFQKFWNPDLGYCYDVIDGPNGNESQLRPNQLFAISLENCPLTAEQQQNIVDVCARTLLTSHGLRSLSPDDPAYVGHYGGDQFKRDSSYHQGTAWGWLLPVFALAHYRAYRDPQSAQSFLEPVAHQLTSAGVGTLSEIFDGDPPFTPRGCVAQAWTVAEVLRVWSCIRKAYS